MSSLGIGSLIGAVATNLVEYLVSSVFVSGFVVLTSGTFQAAVYDNLKSLGRERTYNKIQGRAYALFLVGLGISALLGGYIGEWFGYRWAYVATVAVMVMAVIVTITLVEPTMHKQLTDQKLWAHMALAVRTIRSHKLLVHLGLLVIVAETIRGAHNKYGELFFIALGLTAIPIGYATATKWVLNSLGQLIGPMFGREVLRVVPSFLCISLAFSLIDSAWSLPFYFGTGFFYSMIINQAVAEIQDHTPSEIRATMLSMMTFISNLALVPLGLLFGWIAQVSGVFNAYLMIGCLGMCYLIVWFAKSRKVITTAERAVYAPRSVSTD